MLIDALKVSFIFFGQQLEIKHEKKLRDLTINTQKTSIQILLKRTFGWLEFRICKYFYDLEIKKISFHALTS